MLLKCTNCKTILRAIPFNGNVDRLIIKPDHVFHDDVVQMKDYYEDCYCHLAVPFNASRILESGDYVIVVDEILNTLYDE